MAHHEQMQFVRQVKERFPKMFTGSKVIEIGSLDINGSVRTLFDDCHYLGLDLGPGPGVDMICGGQHATFVDGFFDVAISTECFEHNEAWVQTLSNMIRMSSGLVVFTCASEGTPEHGTSGSSPTDSPFTHEYYRNLSSSDFVQALDLNHLFSVHEFAYQPVSCDLYFWGLVR